MSRGNLQTLIYTRDATIINYNTYYQFISYVQVEKCNKNRKKTVFLKCKIKKFPKNTLFVYEYGKIILSVIMLLND